MTSKKIADSANETRSTNQQIAYICERFVEGSFSTGIIMA